jgi:mono/diheme cytochrome c family protein
MNTHHRYAIAFAFIAAAASAAACGNSDSLSVPDDGMGGGATGGGSGSYSAPAAAATPADSTPPPGVSDNSAKAYFVANVYPLLMTTCGSCHVAPGSDGAPPWLSSASASDAYTMIEGRGYIDLSTSLLLKKGAHEGPALTTAESTAISQWLTLEQQVRGNATPINLLAKLGDCLDPTLFTAIGLDKIQTTPRKTENTDRCTGCNKAYCQNCHEQGEYDMVSNDGKLGVSTIKQLQANATGSDGSYLIEKYITTNGTTLVPATAITEKSTVTQTGPAYSHPMFVVSTDMTAAITAFAQDAITKYNAKTCGQ